MTKLIYFFLMPIYTLSLSANEFGQADLLNNLAALLLPLLTLSISEGVFRFVLDKRENPNELLSIGISIIGICSLIFALCVVCVFSYTKESYWIYFYFYFRSSLDTKFISYSPTKPSPSRSKSLLFDPKYFDTIDKSPKSISPFLLKSAFKGFFTLTFRLIV